MVNQKIFLAVAGNIGVGKSSLTRMAAEQLNWQPFYEAVEENPYLADFYQDMKAWGFHSQIYFLSRRLQHHRQLVDYPGPVIQDRSVYEDAEVFARNLYQQGRLSERDYATYQSLYEGVCAFLPPPDLLVYLQAPVGVLAERISRRGRDYEREISIKYLSDLNTLYDTWVENWDACPVVTIPTAELDFVHHTEDFNQMMTIIQQALNEISD